jgi:YVTN family beta-propeller protein
VAIKRLRPLVGAVLALLLAGGVVAGAVAYLEATPEMGRRARDAEPLVNLEPARSHVVATCRSAQRRAHFAVLCPSRLPINATSAFNCEPPLSPAAQRLHEGGRTIGIDIQSSSVHFGVLGPGGPGVAGPLEGWDDLGPKRLGGRRGLLYFAPHEGMSYHSGHVVFAFDYRGTPYAASLHARSEVWAAQDVAVLGRLVAALRPARRMAVPERPARGRFGSRPVGPGIRIFDVSDVTLGGGRAWAVSYANSKVFPIEGNVRGRPVRVPKNPLEGMIVHRGILWIANSGADVVTGIDSESSTRLVRAKAGDGPQDLAVVDGAIWVLNALDATLSAFTPASGDALGSPLAIPGRPVAFDAGFGRLWVADCKSGSVLALNPSSGDVVSVIEVGPGLNDVLVYDGSVWASAWGAGSVVRIDPDSARVVARIPTGDTPGELAAGRSGLWAADARSASILRIDPRTNEVIETVAVGEAPHGIAVGRRLIWVVDRNRLIRVPIGTLRPSPKSHVRASVFHGPRSVVEAPTQ